MKVSILQIDAVAGTFDSRVQTAMEMVQEAEGDLICLPELWAVGFLSFDEFHESAESITGNLVEQFRNLAQQKKCFISMGSFIEKDNGNFYNTSVTIDADGKIISTYRKIHLFTYAGREHELLSAGDSISIAVSTWGTFGFSTCYDLRFPEQFRKLADKGANIIVTPSAWPLKRIEHYRLFCQSRAVENLSFMISCNCVGGTDSYQLGGNSMIVSPFGDILLEANEEQNIYEVTIDQNEIELWQNKFSALKDKKKEPFWHDQ
ncbi:MAG: carbon-nitrogen hydrolase [Planctomycetota bacterium]|nr:MAG: carbon-nitrogen hydrolase [Planctomycetota bacterium]